MRKVVITFLVLIISSFLVNAGTINVPADYSTIQAGINVASKGDTVLVQPGNYAEHLYFMGKNIMVGSLFIISNDTTYISETVIENVVTFKYGEDSTALLIGFTITNCISVGGCISFSNESSPTISNLIIRGNIAEQGGGIYCEGNSNPYIKDVKIIDNLSKDSGGGIYIRMNSNPTLENVTIIGNTAYFKGGGIYCENSSPTLINVKIIGNRTLDENGWGGGIYCENSSPILNDVTISENSATLRGGGIVCNYNSNPSLTDVVINGNISSDYGGGIYCRYSNPTLKNIFITNNVCNGDEGQGGGICLISSDPNLESLVIENNKATTDGGGMYCESSRPCLKNITISGNSANNGAGIYCKVSAFNLEDVIIIGNEASNNGGGIYFNAFKPNLKNVSILENSADKGGGIYCLYANPILDSVKISENVAEWGGGVYCDNSSPSLYNVIVSENLASANGGGIFCIYNSSPFLFNLKVINNTTYADGGGISCNMNSNPIMVNSTITMNTANNNGGGVDCLCSSPILINTILWNDSKHEIYFYQYEEPDSITIAYSDVQGGETGIVTNNNGTVNWLEGNIDNDPLFVDPDNGNINLQEGSPCIDAGIAFLVWEGDTLVNLNSNDYIGSAPDIGAFEFGETSISSHTSFIPKGFTLYQNYPNPFNPTTTISYQLPKSSFVKLTIYDISGRLIDKLIDEKKNAGYYSVEWNAENVCSGVYFYRIEAGNFVAVKKGLLVK